MRSLISLRNKANRDRAGDLLLANWPAIPSCLESPKNRFWRAGEPTDVAYAYAWGAKRVSWYSSRSTDDAALSR